MHQTAVSFKDVKKYLQMCEVVIQYKWYWEGMIPCSATWIFTGYIYSLIYPHWVAELVWRSSVKSLHQVRHVTWRLAYLQMNWGDFLAIRLELDGAKKSWVMILVVCKGLTTSWTCVSLVVGYPHHDKWYLWFFFSYLLVDMEEG